MLTATAIGLSLLVTCRLWVGLGEGEGADTQWMRIRETDGKRAQAWLLNLGGKGALRGQALQVVCAHRAGPASCSPQRPAPRSVASLLDYFHPVSGRRAGVQGRLLVPGRKLISQLAQEAPSLAISVSEN